MAKKQETIIVTQMCCIRESPKHKHTYTDTDNVAIGQRSNTFKCILSAKARTVVHTPIWALIHTDTRTNRRYFENQSNI